VIVPDVNVLVHAWWAESAAHERGRKWLEEAVAAPEILGLSEHVLSGVVRILTHPRVTGGAFSAADVLERANDVLEAGGVTPVRPGPRHWTIFAQLCARRDARGNTVPDCYRAALAMEHGATWVSLDSFFGTIDGLDWRRPWPAESS